MNRTPDVIVVGLGVMGAATCRALAQRGVAVLGIDTHTPPHDRGSSHGRTRIIREAYFEHPLYVPLVQRAYELWAALEEEARTALFLQTGALMIGPEDGAIVRGALASARTHGLPHELLDADALRRRFPALRPDPHHAAVLEPRAGILRAESCIAALLDGARGAGAELRSGVHVTSWRVASDGDVVLATSDGELRAPRVVLAAGPWLGALAGMELPLRVERQVVHWFRPAPGISAFTADVLPVSIVEHGEDRFVYTLPDSGDGLKAALHHGGAFVDADTVDRQVHGDEIETVRRLLDRYLPGAAHEAVDGTVCLYTNTPDGHFIIDAHPQHPQVTLVSACSGHGFKFAPVIGEAVAELVLDGASRHDLSPFAVSRFADAQGWTARA